MMTPEEAMKRCQTGCTDLQMANNLLAACYGVIGALMDSADRMRLTNEIAIDNLHSMKLKAGRLKAQLDVYKQAINKIDDWFEYGNESRADRDRVHKILGELTDGLRQHATQENARSESHES